MFACSSFSADDANDDSGTEAATGDGPSGADGSAEGAVETCIPQPLDAPDAGEDASCQPGPPVDLSTSSMHCGSCGHDCRGDVCNNGRCAIVDFTSGELGAPTLGSVVQGNIFYTTTRDTELRIRRVPVTGGASQTLFTFEVEAGNAYLGAPNVEGADLYVVHSGIGVLVMPVTGNAPPAIFFGASPNTVTGMLVDTQNVYVVQNGSLSAHPRDNGMSFLIHAGPVGPVTTDGAMLFWTADAANGTTLFARGTNRTDTTVVLATGLALQRAMTVDAKYIYMAGGGPVTSGAHVGDGVIQRIAKSGGTPTLVTKLSGARYPKGLVVDDTSIFIAGSSNEFGGTVDLDLYKAPKCGGFARIVGHDNILTYMLGSDDHLYWGRSANTMGRVTK
jgi:hypothetical protein